MCISSGLEVIGGHNDLEQIRLSDNDGGPEFNRPGLCSADLLGSGGNWCQMKAGVEGFLNKPLYLG